jgi:transcriptional regulator of arginine metabolism
MMRIYCIIMPSKEYRQRLIAELVESEFLSTQAQIAEKLAERGIRVTQATVSRDVTELRLVRVPAGKGQHRYRVTPLTGQEDVEAELKQRFKLFVRDLDRGENIIAIKVDEGHASGVAYVIDKLERDDIVGTLAGQDTILVVARSGEAAQQVLEEFEQLLD